MLGAGLLLLAGGLELASSRRPHGAVRLACVALAMIVLAIVPSSLARPHAAYLHGIVLFLLLAALVLSERVPDAARMAGRRGRRDRRRSRRWALAPALDRRVALAERADARRHDRAPRAARRSTGRRPTDRSTGRTPDTVVLTCGPRYPAYWKASDLDEFDGTRLGLRRPSAATSRRHSRRPSPAQPRARWRQTLTVNAARHAHPST